MHGRTQLALGALLLASVSACGSDRIGPPGTGGSGGAGATAGSGGGDASVAGSGGGGSAGTGGAGGSGGSAGGGSGGSTMTPDAAPTAGSGGSGGAVTPVRCVEPASSAVAPAPQWVNATANLAGMASECNNLAQVAAQPCTKTVVAGIAQRGLWATDDNGKSWRALGTGAGSAAITNRTNSIIFDPAHPEVFWETGIFGSGGLYKTSDGGSTWKRLGTMTFTQLVAVDFADPERKTLLTGTHGMKQQVFRSTDGGQSWTNVGMNLPAGTHNSEYPIVLDARTFLLGACGSGMGTCGIFRSTDAGGSWTRTGDANVSHFGQPLWASDGAIYWPLQGDGGLVKSTDGGVTWTRIVMGGKLVGVTPLELPDKTLVAVGFDQLQRSSDGGITWSPIGEPLPHKLQANNQGGVTYSAQNKTFFLWKWDCGNGAVPVAANAIVSAGFDYTK
jgi:photosystem II stability/assembly factor-like uncharacterized protein